MLDCQGNPREGWPLQMGDIQGQVAVSDVNGDGALELVAADLRGNVVAFTIDGTEIWERHVASQVTQVSCTGLSPGHVQMSSRIQRCLAAAYADAYSLGSSFAYWGQLGGRNEADPWQSLTKSVILLLSTHPQDLNSFLICTVYS